jgi:Spy/CpxP family protein refolding chaperone
MKTNIFMAIALAALTSLTATAQPQRMQPYSGKSPNEVRQVMRPDNKEMKRPTGRGGQRSEGFFMAFQGINLDENQQKEIEKIRLEQVKERTKTRNLMREKRAKLELLQTADKPDMKEINRVIDEIAAIQAQEMKAQAAARQKIRALLNEEQRVQFDSRNR